MKLERAKVVEVVEGDPEWVLVERPDGSREWWLADDLLEYNKEK